MMSFCLPDVSTATCVVASFLSFAGVVVLLIVCFRSVTVIGWSSIFNFARLKLSLSAIGVVNEAAVNFPV
ncbi:hypothetical protein WMY91_00325 [Latilactobacillus sakei]|uniref:hypothetical protein n=1 Tax=Latilactobacillus sakei TaxID=1599 RepID=UPI00232F8163|nr:hypothetical protein [Latilactobacillus sakei]MDB1553655.1 hypothetical protein [Latilactobacillus sakei]